MLQVAVQGAANVVLANHNDAQDTEIYRHACCLPSGSLREGHSSQLHWQA